MKSLVVACLQSLLLACAISPLARAQGAAGPIVIGASLPLTGPNSAAGQEGLDVLRAYFDSVNRAGGIEGRPIELTALDDAFSPQKAAENARGLAAGTTACRVTVDLAFQMVEPDHSFALPRAPRR